jgi:hypothetical protein
MNGLAWVARFVAAVDIVSIVTLIAAELTEAIR